MGHGPRQKHAGHVPAGKGMLKGHLVCKVLACLEHCRLPAMDHRCTVQGYAKLCAGISGVGLPAQAKTHPCRRARMRHVAT